MFEEIHEHFKSESSPEITAKWLELEVSSILDPSKADEYFSLLVEKDDISLETKSEQNKQQCIPIFGVTNLKEKGIEGLCESLKEKLKVSLYPLRRSQSAVLFAKQQSIWNRVVFAHRYIYTSAKLKKALEKLSEEEYVSKQEKEKKEEKKDLKDASDILIEVGVNTSLNMVFSLLRQTWAQMQWQKQLHQAITAQMGNGMFFFSPFLHTCTCTN